MSFAENASFPTVSIDFLLNLVEEWKIPSHIRKMRPFHISFLSVTKHRKIGPKSVSSLSSYIHTYMNFI